MRTGITISESRKRGSIIAAVTGSAAIIALSIAFVAVDFRDFFLSPSFRVNTEAIAALEPTRSDTTSEPSGSGNDYGSGSNDGGSGGSSDGNDPNGNGSYLSGDYADHSEPCLDPNCPIHHGGEHGLPCDDPNCPIHNGHGLPCDDPDCPIHNGHELPCDDPDCPIHGRPPVNIPMETIGFKPNLYEYVDKDAAYAVLSEYIQSFDDYFERYPDGKIYLVGSIAKTASWSITETELSQQRADAVRQSLIELGVDESKLISIGIGINDPWRNDEWVNGYFDEEIAKTNRRVWIIPDQYSDQVRLVLDIEAEIEDIKASE